MSKDNVNHPSHYNSGKIEVIEAIEDWKLGFHLGNAVKYIARAGKKDPAKVIEDLEKAIWYVRRQIALTVGNPPRPNEMPQERVTPKVEAQSLSRVEVCAHMTPLNESCVYCKRKAGH
jgi:hypothetical protein